MKSKSQLIAESVLSFKPRKVLDIGYAQEPNSFLRNPETTVYGLDIVEAAAPYDRTWLCDLNTEPLPFQDMELDAVTMGCTLAHVAKPLRVLAEVNRVLKQGGALVLSSPNPNYYWETVLNIFYRHFANRVSNAKHEEHFYEFSRYNMRTCSSRTGFHINKEIGCTFQLVKTPLRFNPVKAPGLAYEIIYVMTKTGVPKSFTTFETPSGIVNVPTNLY